MKIVKTVEVPTGHILVGETAEGRLVEFLSIGDYGKDVNLKADFLGLDRHPDRVRHTKLLPLEEKWVVTISTQYGCSMGCTFCDVPKVGRGRNIFSKVMIDQVRSALALHPEVQASDRLNIHFARMGEPTFNPEVLEAAKWFHRHLPGFRVHPVVSTMMPKRNKHLWRFLTDWMEIKNDLYQGNAGLQLSINSTNEMERAEMFRGSALSIPGMGPILPWLRPEGRKITLNFALGGWEIDPDVLLKYFSPDRFLIKLTPLHRTRAVDGAGSMPGGDFTSYTPYEDHEEALRAAGYDVIVFIASEEEDSSRITCGNAILADMVGGA